MICRILASNRRFGQEKGGNVGAKPHQIDRIPGSRGKQHEKMTLESRSTRRKNQKNRIGDLALQPAAIHICFRGCFFLLVFPFSSDRILAHDFPPAASLVALRANRGRQNAFGQLIEQRGLWGAGFRQFDFGASLRTIGPPEILPMAGSQLMTSTSCAGVLQSGALLEDAHFPLARRILQSFLQQHQVGPDTRIVLNGLPRHAGQAVGLEAIVDVRWVVSLQCTAETVLARIAGNVGGDRRERTDDDPQAVRGKLEIFVQRTHR